MNKESKQKLKANKTLYTTLTKKLKKIKSKRKFTNYQKQLESKDIIDEFYKNNTTIDKNFLYDRLCYLKNEIEQYKQITIPIYITIILSLFIPKALKIVEKFISMFTSSLSEFDAIATSGIMNFPKNDLSIIFRLKEYNNILLYVIIGYIITIIIISSMLIFVGNSICAPLKYKYAYLRFLIFEYEINILELKFKELESKHFIPLSVKVKKLKKYRHSHFPLTISHNNFY